MRFILCAFALFLSTASAIASGSPFRLHLTNEPSSLDPNKQRTSASSYLLGNLYRNIYSFDDKKGLVPALGSCLREKNQTLRCTLKKDLKWSDGSALTSTDFLKTYQKILDPKFAAPRADLLFKIKNAKEIYAGKLPMKDLGIKTPSLTEIVFEFGAVDADFEYNLASFLLAPTKENLVTYSGPYVLKKWLKGQKIQLEANPQDKDAKLRPPVEFLFIEEDTVALQLYEKNELQFLRRLPTLFIARYKNRPDFQWVPVTRLDYIGFGPQLKDQENIRKALTYSMNYPELQRIFSAEGLPGCVGVPSEWFPENKRPCFEYDLKKVPKVKTLDRYTFMFSSLGGDDHKRATEWMQSQWQKNAGLSVHLEMKENKIYLQTLQNNPPALFRKGVSIDRPTCLAALETFSPDSSENFLHLKSEDYNKILNGLATAKSEKQRKQLCLEGMNFLMNHHLLIPLGPIHFSMLAKPEFKGWKLNQMNQLDLQDLRFIP